MTPGCPFCSVDVGRLFYADELVIGLWDAFPVARGHALLIPKRHIASWFEASDDERAALLRGLDKARERIEQEHRPDAYNIGVNVGASAGQTVEHLHVHLIPRYAGDVADPRGGVRAVIPDKANYLGGDPPSDAPLGGSPELDAMLGAAPHARRLVRGEDDHLLPHLLAHLDHARSVDIAVAFVMQSGMSAIEPRLQELLARGGQLRFLTGDYLGGTDPDALLRLLDLQQLDAPGTVQLRVFESRERPFHPKVYVFSGNDDAGGIAFVGSSNLSHGALTHGVEWNYRVVSSGDRGGYQEVVNGFDSLFQHPSTRELDEAWIDAYRERRPQSLLAGGKRGSGPPPPGGEAPVYGTETEHESIPVVAEDPESPPEPHPVQAEALAALRATRQEGYQSGLVVLATGLGKTWLSAFDSVGNGFKRVLFVAHRDEILGQALSTYRKIAPKAHLGRFTGTEKVPHADVVFASIQTLARTPNLRVFDPREFDYIVVDEFHHAAARTYRKVIDYFEPAFLLGLTATPERTDGGDLLALCQENMVFRRDVAEGIRLKLLSKFKYFGVPDTIDYAQIPWRGRRFDEEELTKAAATQARAENALEQYEKHKQTRTLAFCVSIRHADFMAEFFRDRGIRAVAVHSGERSSPRTRALEQLAAGELDVIFTVDIFNEGVDLPAVDTVLMLRPTESRILWQQQFGRGLRVSEDKDHLSVIDYIGNHRTFLLKAQTLLGLGSSDRELSLALKRLEAGEFELPPGCEVTYELQAMDIMRGLLRPSAGTEQLREFCGAFQELHGSRPRAVEAYHEGYNPRAARKSSGSWLSLLSMEGLLSEGEVEAHTAAKEFLTELEVTPMTKSYKMLTLLALLRADALPGTIAVDDLAGEVRTIAKRSPKFLADFTVDVDDRAALADLLVKNPVAAFVGGSGMGGHSYFELRDGALVSELEVSPELRGPFQDLVREIVDWRLAEYLQRPATRADGFTCRVSHSSGNPIIFLPNRETAADVPSGWTTVNADGEQLEANFVKVAVNVMREPGGSDNVLPRVLRAWFGDNAGHPGTNHQVFFERTESGLSMLPIGAGGSLWQTFARKEIPGIFGVPFNEARWRAGYVALPPHIFLLVTLDKTGMDSRYEYKDKFLGPDRFQWQSQNRTPQAGVDGKRISKHDEMGLFVHLFVRKTPKIDGKAARYYYCGELDFLDWEGEKPITVQWKLREPVPEALHEMFGIGPEGGAAP